MKLSNLEVYATMRFTQPNVGDESQTLDIEFDVTKGAKIDNELYMLAFYGMLNGYVNGEDGVVTTGVKFSFYDESDVLIAESIPSKIDMVVDEMYTRLEATSETVITDSTINVYIARIDISFVANDEDVAKESMILTSPAAATNIFSEIIGAGPEKGIMLENGNETNAQGTFILQFRT